MRTALSLYDKYKDDILHEQNALIAAFNVENVSMHVADNIVLNATPLQVEDKTKILHIMGDMKNILTNTRLINLFWY